MTTARTTIIRALRRAGIIGRYEEPTADEVNDALLELNDMLDEWSNDSMTIYARTLEDFPLLSGVSEYTIGPGADFNTARPMHIASAFVRSAGTDYPLTVIPDTSWVSIQQKAVGSVPQWLCFDNDNPIGKIRLWPVPAGSYRLFLLQEKPLTSIPSLNTDLTFPPGWHSAILNNLAVRLCPDYGQSASDELVAIAARGRSAIRRTIRRNLSMDYDVNSVQTHRDIFRGWT
jgi:hypothetical protein